MLSVTVTAVTSATPEQVLALAGTDFSGHRARIWPNVSGKGLEVHAHGETCVDVTERAALIGGLAWERSRYDWSEPGSVKQIVNDSNVLEPGSTWELSVAPRDGGGSEVRMKLERRFRRGPIGRFASAFNHLSGRRGWGFMLRMALRAVERSPA
jgi:hypothetical protein